MKPGDETPRVRLDKWLWAARFFKTRPLATAAVNGGRVHVEGGRAKPAYGVKPGDRLRISKGEQVFLVEVVALAERRGPASAARQLYEETAESAAARREAAERRRLHAAAAPRPAHRPDKRSRRKLQHVKRGD